MPLSIYVVKMEVYAALDPMASVEDDDDRDHLQEIQDILERLEDAEDDRIGDDVYQQMRFDLCSECRRKFVRSPLGQKSDSSRLCVMPPLAAASGCVLFWSFRVARSSASYLVTLSIAPVTSL